MLPPTDGTPLVVAIDDTSGGAGAAFVNYGTPNDASRRFQFVDLDQGIPEQVSPEYATTQVVGRAEQFKTFAGATNREIPLIFHFHVQGNSQAGGTIDDAINAEVISPVLWLQRLAQPVLQEDQGIWFPPPTCVLVIGRLLNMRCVVTTVATTWMGPWQTATLLPHRAVVSINFTSVSGGLGNPRTDPSGWSNPFRNQKYSQGQLVLNNQATYPQ